MPSLTLFVIAGWLVITSSSLVMLRVAYRAHAMIDKGNRPQAHIDLLLALGCLLFGATVCGFCYAVRWEIAPLVWPAITGSAAAALTTIFITRGYHRLRTE